MLNRTETNIALAAILEVADASIDGAPAGALYAGMMGSVSLGDFQALVRIGVSGGLLREVANVIKVTPQGTAMVAKIVAHRAAQVIGRAARPADYRDGEWGRS